MTVLLQDVRYALRVLIKSPGFSLVSILTLALGIGANAAIFTVVNALLLKPLPYGAPDRLVTVWQDFRGRGGPVDEWATPGNYADWRQARKLFDQIAVITNWGPALTGSGEAEMIPGEQVSHEYFEVLGISPAMGRGFAQTDDVPNARRVVIIGHDLWQRRFGSNPSAVGQVVQLAGESHEIIGVLPQGFRPVIQPLAQVWRPLRLNTATPSRGAIILRSVARLPEGLDTIKAQAAATTLAKQLEATYPDSNAKVGISIVPLHDRVVGNIRPGLLAILGAVGFVLLIACANIANLLLARGSARGRELAVRVALGAARGRVIRQLLTESVLLAAIGGIAGLLLGMWTAEALVAIAPQNSPLSGAVHLDGRVLTFVGVLTLFTGLLFGMAPAWQSSRRDVTHSLKDGGRGSAGVSGRAIRKALVIAEVALALVLLTGAGLLLQTFVRLQAADLGFRTENVLVGFFNPPRAKYQNMQQYIAFYDQVLARATALPGVRTAALASVLPLGGDNDTDFQIEGRAPATSPGDATVTWYRLVSASYFDAMGMRMLRGRGFEPREASPAVVVNETFVRRYFPGQDAIGRRVRFGDGAAPWAEIVGVVADARVRGARGESRVETFVPYWQMSEQGMNVVLHTAGNPMGLAESVRKIVGEVDRDVPVSSIRTLDQIVGMSIQEPKFFATLALAFGVLAVALAGIGIYGVMAYAVDQRTAEIGVRMALGAAPMEVFRLVIGDGLRLAAAGIVVGAAGAYLVARWLKTMLFEVEPGDPATLAATATVLILIAIAACVIPARRATRVDPMVALRAE
jgi:putative ABC transport system permease protein